MLDYYSGLYGNPKFSINSDYWNWVLSNPSPLESYYTAEPPVGLTVCNQGWRTGSQCGTIHQVNQTVKSTEVTDTNMTEIVNDWSCKGDSGSPVDSASSDTAIGMHDLGDGLYEKGECSKTLWASTIGEAVSTWNLTVYGFGSEFGPW